MKYNTLGSTRSARLPAWLWLRRHRRPVGAWRLPDHAAGREPRHRAASTTSTRPPSTATPIEVNLGAVLRELGAGPGANVIVGTKAGQRLTRWIRSACHHSFRRKQPQAAGTHSVDLIQLHNHMDWRRPSQRYCGAGPTSIASWALSRPCAGRAKSASGGSTLWVRAKRSMRPWRMAVFIPSRFPTTCSTRRGRRHAVRLRLPELHAAHRPLRTTEYRRARHPYPRRRSVERHGGAAPGRRFLSRPDRYG